MPIPHAPVTVSRPSPDQDGVVRAGAARVDITPPLGGGLAGHGFVAQVALGSLGRLWATALVLDDGRGRRVALVTADLAAGSRWVLARVAELVHGETGLGLDTIVPLVAHSHRAPASILGNHTYDRIMGPLFVEQADHHFDRETAELVAQRIASALTVATAALEPAEVHLGECSADGLLWNRSASAYRGLRVDQDNDDQVENGGVFTWPTLAVEDAERLSRWLRETPPAMDLSVDSEPTDRMRALALDRWTDLGPRAHFAELSMAVDTDDDGPPETGVAGDGEDAEDVDDPPTGERWEARQTERIARYIEKHADGRTLDEIIVALGRKGLGGLPPALKLILENVHLEAAPSPSASSLRVTDDRVPWVVARARTGDRLIGAIGILNGTPTLVGSRVPVFCADVPGLTSMELSRRLGAPVGIGAGALGDVNVVPLHPDIDALTDRKASVQQQMDRALEAARELARRSIGVLGAPARPGSSVDAWSAACWEATRDRAEHATTAHLGASALAGSDLGRSSLAVLIREGARASRPSAQPLQDPKKLLPRLGHPPDRFLFHRLTLGRGGPVSVVLFATPFEVSHALAARIRDEVRRVPGFERSRVVTASLSTDFGGYAGTPWEYISQSYEAASTLWGRRTGPWLKTQLANACRAAPVPPATLRFSGGPMQGAPAHFRRQSVFRGFGTRNRVMLDDRAWVLERSEAARRGAGALGSTIEVRLPIARSVAVDRRVDMGGPLVTVHGLDPMLGSITDQTVPVLQVMVLGRPRRSWYLRIVLPVALPAGPVEVRVRDPITGAEHRLAC